MFILSLAFSGIAVSIHRPTVGASVGGAARRFARGVRTRGPGTTEDRRTTARSGHTRPRIGGEGLGIAVLNIDDKKKAYYRAWFVDCAEKNQTTRTTIRAAGTSQAHDGPGAGRIPCKVKASSYVYSV